MSRLRPRGSSVFSGLILIFIGLLLLLHNYRGFELSGIIIRWWPLILIFWGALKIYERTAGRSEEHTSELQSHSDIVCRLLLEKKKKSRMNSKTTLLQLTRRRRASIRMTSCMHIIRCLRIDRTSLLLALCLFWKTRSLPSNSRV